MTATRSKTGATPRRPDHPGFVETPARQRRSRKSTAPNGSAESGQADLHERTQEATAHKHEAPKDALAANGSVKSASKVTSKSKAAKQVKDPKIDNSGIFEFGGSAGALAIIIGSPLLMYYMWIGATYYDGQFPAPAKDESFLHFIRHLGQLIYTGAFPSLKAWAIYWVFFVFQAACYLYMPGVYAYGKPLPHLGGKQLQYYCSAVSSFYFTNVLAIVFHVTGVFKLYTLMDEFGPLMSVAIISGFTVSIIAYASAIARGAEHRMTGYVVYDFFMGAELNPRMFGWLDFKMFCEVRLPWFILFYITLGACARQYEQFGYVSGELAFLLMAHFLYANACCKGEELIPPTWDMYYEKWGWMLAFWNLAGVPLTYCHCTIYLGNHHPSTYRWPRAFLVLLYVSYLFAYWIWDTAGSQKNYFRGSQRGTAIERNTFPQLPWKHVKNPETIPVPSGDDLLCDGWYKYARKIHYTCDMYFALCWGLITGFGSPFPWFYPIFFAAMISHRALRDIQRCRERYGEAWAEYERRVPYLFIPGVL